MSEKQNLISRWDIFLARLQERFYQSLEQGKEAVLESLNENGYDYYASYRTLSGIESQIIDSIIQKIDPIWQDQVEPLMQEDDGDDTFYWIDEMKKGNSLNDKLFAELNLWKIVCEGELSQKYYDYAIQLVNKDFRCTQCNAPIKIQKDIFQSQYLPCDSCSAVNTFVPETKYVQIGHNAINNIATLYALSEWKKVQELQYSNPYDDYNEYLAVYEDAYRAYLEKYFEKRIQLMPHTAETYEQDINREIKKIIHN